MFFSFRKPILNSNNSNEEDVMTYSMTLEHPFPYSVQTCVAPLWNGRDKSLDYFMHRVGWVFSDNVNWFVAESTIGIRTQQNVRTLNFTRECIWHAEPPRFLWSNLLVCLTLVHGKMTQLQMLKTSTETLTDIVVHRQWRCWGDEKNT